MNQLHHANVGHLLRTPWQQRLAHQPGFSSSKLKKINNNILFIKKCAIYTILTLIGVSRRATSSAIWLTVSNNLLSAGDDCAELNL